MAELQDELLPLTRMKSLLGMAEAKSLGYAMAFDGSKKDFVLLVDRRLAGKKVAAKLRKDAGTKIDDKTIRFGRLRINQAEDPGTVKLQVQKSALPGTIPVLVRLVKRAGYQAAVIDVNAALEDDEADTPETDADEASSQEQAAPVAEEATPPPPPPAPPPPPPTAPPPPDAKMVLATLARRIGAVTDPALKARLSTMARDAGAKLNTGAPIAAELKAIGAELSGAAATATNGIAEPPKATDGPKVALAKSSAIWRSCRSQLHGKLDSLKTAILAAYGDEPEIQAAVRQNLGALDRVFDRLDDRLDTALDAAASATTDGDRQKFVEQSKAVINEYTAVVSTDPLIAQLDENPFGIDMKFRDTLDRVLPALTGLAQTLH